MRDGPDTAEFLVPDAGYQRVQTFTKEQQERIEELEDALRRLARKVHNQQHPPLTPSHDCHWSTCEWVRSLLD